MGQGRSLGGQKGTAQMGIIVGPLLIYFGLELYMPWLCEYPRETIALTYFVALFVQGWASTDSEVIDGPAGTVC